MNSKRGPSWILDQIFPADRSVPQVTVLDGHPHTLAFLATINNVPARNLGVSRFGQAGDVGAVYRYHGIDIDNRTSSTGRDGVSAATLTPMHSVLPSSIGRGIDRSRRVHSGTLTAPWTVCTTICGVRPDPKETTVTGTTEILNKNHGFSHGRSLLLKDRAELVVGSCSAAGRFTTPDVSRHAVVIDRVVIPVDAESGGIGGDRVTVSDLHLPAGDRAQLWDVLDVVTVGYRRGQADM